MSQQKYPRASFRLPKKEHRIIRQYISAEGKKLSQFYITAVRHELAALGLLSDK